MIIAMSFSKAESQRARLIPLILVVSRPAFVEKLSGTAAWFLFWVFFFSGALTFSHPAAIKNALDYGTNQTQLHRIIVS